MSQIVIKQIAFTPAGTSEDMVTRNYVTHITGNTVDILGDRTGHGGNLTPEALSGIAGQILIPDLNSSRALQVAGGWGGERYRFIIHAQIDSGSLASNINYYYTGYTDFSTYSPTAQDFAPEMRLYINNVVCVSKTMIYTPNGMVPHYQVNDVSHLLHPRSLGMDYQTRIDIGNNGMQPISQPSTLRPEDVFAHLATQSLQQTLQEPVLNLSTAVDAKKTNRLNNVPNQWLSKTLQPLKRVMEDPQRITSSRMADIYNAASGETKEASTFADPLIASIGAHGYFGDGCISWQALKQSHPEVMADRRTRFVDNGVEVQTADGARYVARRGTYQTFVDNTGRMNTSAEAMLVTAITQSIPGVLLVNLVGRCRIVASNMNVGGQISVQMTDVISFTDLPQGWLISRVPQIEQTLRATIFNDLPINTHIPFLITIVIDIFGQTFVEVSYNGAKPQPFAIPQYSDAMFSPMVSPNITALDQISNDLSYISEGIR